MGQTQHPAPPSAISALPAGVDESDIPAWASGTWPPPRLRVYESRRALRAGVALGLAATIGFASRAMWIAAPAAALLALGCGLLWFVRLPVLEFSEFGASVFLNGPFRRPLFAPWPRVRAVQRERDAGSGEVLVIEFEGAEPMRWPQSQLDSRLDRLLASIERMRGRQVPPGGSRGPAPQG